MYVSIESRVLTNIVIEPVFLYSIYNIYIHNEIASYIYIYNI